MHRLSLATLADVRAGAGRPRYDPTHVGIGIVHLGLGAFHRAHQAEIVDRLLDGDRQWGISGVRLKTPTARDHLVPQDGLYTFLTRSV